MSVSVCLSVTEVHWRIIARDASSCQILSKFLKRLEIFRFFFEMVAIRHFGFVGHILGPPAKSIWSSYYNRSNFSPNPFRSFHNKKCKFDIYFACLAGKGLFTPLKLFSLRSDPLASSAYCRSETVSLDILVFARSRWLFNFKRLLSRRKLSGIPASNGSPFRNTKVTHDEAIFAHPSCLPGTWAVSTSVSALVVKFEEINLKFNKVRKSSISAFNHSSYRKTLNILNIVSRNRLKITGAKMQHCFAMTRTSNRSDSSPFTTSLASFGESI